MTSIFRAIGTWIHPGHSRGPVESYRHQSAPWHTVLLASPRACLPQPGSNYHFMNYWRSFHTCYNLIHTKGRECWVTPDFSFSHFSHFSPLEPLSRIWSLTWWDPSPAGSVSVLVFHYDIFNMSESAAVVFPYRLLTLL